MYDLAMRVKELVGADPDRARNKDILVRLLAKEMKDLGDKDRSELFMLLLTEYVNHHVRRPTGPKKPKPGTAVTPVSAVSPMQAQLQRAQLMEQAGKRPLYIPSMVSATNDGWVAYNDMTRELWMQYVESRQRFSRISASLAMWGTQNLTALREHGATTSGDLPDQIREGLLRRQPQGREIALPEAAPPRELTHRA